MARGQAVPTVRVGVQGLDGRLGYVNGMFGDPVGSLLVWSFPNTGTAKDVKVGVLYHSTAHWDLGLSSGPGRTWSRDGRMS